MTIAKLDDLAMYYEVHGDGEPLVLISGFSADHTRWESVVNKLAAHFKVIVFDNRGAGQTTVTPGPYSIKQMAEDVVRLCDYLHIDSAYFCGNSMGGCILQTLACAHPQRVKKAIISNSALIMSTPFSYYVQAQYQLLKTGADQEALIQTGCAFSYSYHFLSQPGVLDEAIRLSVQNPYPFTLEGYAAQADAIGEFDSREWAGKIRVPTLVVGSTEDIIFNRSLTEAVAEAIPGAEYYCFEKAGHVPHIEYPDQFIELLLGFIQA